jgi:uncharacterized protein (TIGR00661 family)
MRFLFVVQGEGRGHMTQAISLSQMLVARGHEICAVCVGRSRLRTIPQFFVDRIGAPITTYGSPTFKTDPSRRGVSLLGTALDNFIRLPAFARGVRTLHQTVTRHKPDVVVNFFDPLAAIYGLLFRSRPTMMCIGHQYLLLHPDFVFPKISRFARLALVLYIRFCALGSERILALSFRKMPSIPNRKLSVVPPLLRKELRHMNPVTEDFILAYVLNDGYANDIASQQRRFPDVSVVGFWDRKGAAEETWLQENLLFRQLNDVAFLDAMNRCRGLMSTAGFESICEAMYLGKPVYMVPANRQVEQHCNALDGSTSGAGIWGPDFDLERFLDYVPHHRNNSAEFRSWADSGEPTYSHVFERLT